MTSIKHVHQGIITTCKCLLYMYIPFCVSDNKQISLNSLSGGTCKKDQFCFLIIVIITCFWVLQPRAQLKFCCFCSAEGGSRVPVLALVSLSKILYHLALSFGRAQVIGLVHTCSSCKRTRNTLKSRGAPLCFWLTYICNKYPCLQVSSGDHVHL